MNNKLLLIISGEAFREGGQGSRKKDTDTSLHTQLLASDSHVELIDHIQNKYNLDCDIQILSYNSKFKNELINKYTKYNLTHHFYEKYFRDRTQLTNSVKIDTIIDKYVGVLVIRPDMYIKKYFLDVFDPFVEQIHYISVCFLYHHICRKNIPRINDASIFIPNKYFQSVYYDIGIKLYHEAIVDYLGHGMHISDFNFFLKTMHDSDSAKDYNPLFYLVSRPQNKIWHSYGYEVHPPYFEPKLYHKKYNFSDWNIKDNIKDIQNIDDYVNYNHLWEWWHQDPNKFFKFINLINIDTNNNNQMVETKPLRHPDETFWKLEDNDKLTFYNKNQDITAILYKNNDKEFFGGSIKHNYKFMIKKLL